MAIIGTSHFISHDAALRYYRPYYYATNLRWAVSDMIASGEITIGKPPEQPDHTIIVDTDGRYHYKEQGQ